MVWAAVLLCACVATDAVPPHASKALLDAEMAAAQPKDPRLHGNIPKVADFRATVVRVDRREVILRITANPERRPLWPGTNFAIYNDNVYKGEARVLEVLPDYDVRCRADIVKAEFHPGDLAATKVQ